MLIQFALGPFINYVVKPGGRGGWPNDYEKLRRGEGGSAKWLRRHFWTSNIVGLNARLTQLGPNLQVVNSKSLNYRILFSVALNSPWIKVFLSKKIVINNGHKGGLAKWLRSFLGGLLRWLRLSTRGRGVKKLQIYDYVVYEWPLSEPFYQAWAERP